ncbi:SpoVR family protein [Rubeoparvulum massiliense]|uniref:SpoVR family protein n=1 Tax=Rubeoparvulum massiliense TaxID=1631346 RepID=UPI00065E31A6|nr:SpoVR family protein [Rubeoparvulum massiliense]
MVRDAWGELEQAIEQLTSLAKLEGLDFFDMRYEVCPPDILYTFGAYGMPTRYSHWSFGKAFYRMKLDYDLGLSRIYELVINSDPCYAFLLEGNSLIQNKMIVAHVLGHSDFFKNNQCFTGTNRKMVHSMTLHAERIRQYEMLYGRERVERFLDAAMAFQEHIEPSGFKEQSGHKKEQRIGQKKSMTSRNPQRNKNPYEELWKLDQWNSSATEAGEERGGKRYPSHPEKDILFFILQHSSYLEEWQRDILSIVRDEMRYFWPQIETKIMNEGWATYWHTRLLRQLDLDEGETIEFACLHSQVIHPSSTGINPYYLGYRMFEALEKRWGREKIFEIREVESDQSFLRNYLNGDIIEDLDLYLFSKEGREYKITSKNWEEVRDHLVNMRVNGGFPYLMVEDADYGKQGGLYIRHYYEGIELDIQYLEKCLPYLYQLWGTNVYLETILDQREFLFSYDGEKTKRTALPHV